MKVALLSDVHSNHPALEAVLRAVDSLRPDKVIVLGDTVGYNASPVECLDLVKSRADLVLLGNHDAAALDQDTSRFSHLAQAGIAHTVKHLRAPHIEYLKHLSPRVDQEIGGVRFTFVHGSIRDPLFEYVFPGGAQQMLEWLHATLPDDAPRVVVQGHTHIPMYLAKAAPRKHALHLMNPGSVGQPRDGDPRAAFALFDTDRLEPTFHRVAYDIQAAIRANEAAELPRELARVLVLGR